VPLEASGLAGAFGIKPLFLQGKTGETETEKIFGARQMTSDKWGVNLLADTIRSLFVAAWQPDCSGNRVKQRYSNCIWIPAVAILRRYKSGDEVARHLFSLGP